MFQPEIAEKLSSRIKRLSFILSGLVIFSAVIALITNLTDLLSGVLLVALSFIVIAWGRRSVNFFRYSAILLALWAVPVSFFIGLIFWIDFTLLALGLLFAGVKVAKKLYPAQFLLLLSVSISIMMFIVYLYKGGEPGAAYEFAHLLVLGFAALFLESGLGVMYFLAQRGGAGVLTRRLIPTVLLLPPMFGYLAIRSQGVLLFDTSFSMAAVTMANMGTAGILVWITAAKISSLDEKLERSKEALRVEKEQSDSFLSAIGDGVIAIDRSWRITLFNKGATLITGVAANKALGRGLMEIIKFVRERDRKEDMSFIEEAMVAGRVLKITERTVLMKKDGSEIAVGDSVAPIFDKRGTAKGAIIVFRDLTDERQQEMLRSDFAYASHQIRTPVTQAIWTLDAAMEERDPKIKNDLLQDSWRALESVQKLSDDLVSVSALDQKRVIPNIKKVSLGQIFAEVAENFKQKIDLPNVDMEIDTDPEIFNKILREVIENAIIYGTANPKISARQTADGALISVLSKGKKIIEEELPLVFTKFFRGNNKGAAPGAGLGLYIARGYLDLLRGKIWFESDEKRTVFNIFLPRPKA